MDDFFASIADQLDRSGTFASPGELAAALDPEMRQTPALQMIDDALVEVAEGREKRLMVFMPPQEGKSQRVSHYFPLWMLHRNPDLRIGIVSYQLDLASRWGMEIRTDILTFDGDEGNIDLGLRLRKGSTAKGAWRLQAHRGGLICVGIDGALTGRPLDLLIIDDPVKGRGTAESKRLQQLAWDFWTGTARTRMAPGSPVVLIMTRWDENDIAGQMLEQARTTPGVPDWRVISIPAQCEDAESDLLGREAGEYMASARAGRENEWEEIKATVGSRDWAALYQQRPAPQDGNILKREWWQFYDLPRAIRQDDGSWRAIRPGRLIQSWDMAFKDTDSSDFVVGQVWQQDGTTATLLDQVRRRMDFTETKQAVLQMSAKWPQATLKLIEDKANGPAVISALRKEIGGVVEYQPRDSKQARAYAVAPFIEAANVWLPSPQLAPWVGEFIDECSAFPNAAHDDQVDACTQALTRLFLEGGTATNYMQSLLRERGVTVLADRRSRGA